VLHHGAIGIIRSLGRMGVPVYAVVEDRFTPAAVSKYLTGAFVWETHGLDAQRLLEGMAIIGARLNRPKIVIPTDDVADLVLADESWLLPVGARTTTILRTPEQAYAIYRNAESHRVPNLIFQEYIAPAYSEDWFYHGYRNMRSDCCVGFTGRKLRSYPPFAGPTRSEEHTSELQSR